MIKTDRPRFETITVEDDGLGMSPATVAHLLHHIGGSAKRALEGAELGIANAADPRYSPSGRRLIGKIGIGLFSVAQLTHRFQIITKVAGDPFRTIATVVLRQYSDEGPTPDDEHEEYEAGRVNVWREAASDPESHGTSIILTDIRPQTQDTLRSLDLWAAIDSDQSLAPEEARDIRPPTFHIGRTRRDDPDALAGENGSFESVPWSHGDEPAAAFQKLVNAIWQHVDRGSPNPQLERVFDYYLRMVWQLSLAIPARYAAGNPFELPFGDDAYVYELPASVRAAPVALELSDGETIIATRSIGSTSKVGADFRVLFDDLELARPMVFTELPTTSHAVRKPIIFAAHCREEFDGIPRELAGGPLEFEAYLMWAPKIAPTEHQGSLVRIHGASGTLFDPTFMRYQVSEQTRLRQISCEIFVSDGLEAALNIDRESFNYAHPHVVYLTKWLHSALRRVATVQKRIAADIRQASRKEAAAKEEQALTEVAAEAWREESDDPGAEPPPVRFEEPGEEAATDGSAYRFRREAVFGDRGRRPSRHDESVERKLRAIVQLLAAYALLDDLSEAQQERLLAGLRKIIEADDG